jgi:hypothetical protein
MINRSMGGQSMFRKSWFSVCGVVVVSLLVIQNAGAKIHPVRSTHRQTAQTETPADSCSVPLMAGQHQAVGDVSVLLNDGVNLVIMYRITDGYSRIRATHLYVGAKSPTKSAPGLFPFKHENLNTDTDVFVIPLSTLGLPVGACVYVAAHAEVDAAVTFKPADFPAFHAGLPDTADIIVSYPGGGDSYLDGMVLNGGLLDGTYDNWCVDTDHEIMPGETYHTEVLSSLEPLPPGLLEFPENIDMVNFVLNEGYPGTESLSAGPFTWGDVQHALWTLIDDVVPSGGVGTEPFEQSRVDEIVADAYARGEGFVPGCNELAGVILNPIDEQNGTVAQITIIEVPLRCQPVFSRETAWGSGGYKFRTGWGSYFRCCPAP